MPDRFYVNSPVASGRAELVDAEAHHLIHVLRARAGHEVTLFDGGGAEFHARIAVVGRSTVELEVLSRQEVDRELSFSLTLGVALPKGDRQRWLVEKATELGVTRLTPLETQRGVAQPTDSALVKLRRAVIEASKQCGRNRLLEITEPAAADQFWSAHADAARLIAHPGGRAAGVVLRELSFRGTTAGASPNIVAAIGPEGGFTDAEVAAAHQAGWHAVSLGPRILRIETAALKLAAICADL